MDLRQEEEAARRGLGRGRQIDRLIADLQSGDAVRRDAAVARLRVHGARALPRLVAFITSSGPSDAKALALTALEGIPDPHVVEIALNAIDSPDADTVVAALGVLRGWVTQETGTRLLEAVSAIAVDRSRDGRVRVAAIEALSELPEHLIRPIREQGPPPESAGPTVDDPIAARDWVEAHGRAATLATLHDSVKAFREHEESARTGRDRHAWLEARGAAHKALADRGSRLALYDLRETFTAARAALPAGFLEAITAIGDASCLEPLAHAWSATRGAEWRGQILEAAQRIVRRSKLGARSAVVKHIRANWEGFL